MDYMKDVSVIYVRLITDDKALSELEDKINDLLCDTKGVTNSLVEVYDNVEQFENRYEDPFYEEC